MAVWELKPYFAEGNVYKLVIPPDHYLAVETGGTVVFSTPRLKWLTGGVRLRASAPLTTKQMESVSSAPQDALQQTSWGCS